MTKYYDKEIDLATQLALGGRNRLVISTEPYDGGGDALFKVYYMDSEWTLTPGVGSMEINTLDAADVGFGDGIDWLARSPDTTVTGTVQFIVVRKSDRKTILFHADADGTTLANATWTFTDVTGKVWHEGLRKLRILGYV